MPARAISVNPLSPAEFDGALPEISGPYSVSPGPLHPAAHVVGMSATSLALAMKTELIVHRCLLSVILHH